MPKAKDTGMPAYRYPLNFSAARGPGGGVCEILYYTLRSRGGSLYDGEKFFGYWYAGIPVSLTNLLNAFSCLLINISLISYSICMLKAKGINDIQYLNHTVFLVNFFFVFSGNLKVNVQHLVAFFSC